MGAHNIFVATHKKYRLSTNYANIYRRSLRIPTIVQGIFVPESSITKDNPAFSMINDSDEDVIYGSDEESRRPLNSHHRVNEEI